MQPVWSWVCRGGEARGVFWSQETADQGLEGQDKGEQERKRSNGSPTISWGRGGGTPVSG